MSKSLVDINSKVRLKTLSQKSEYLQSLERRSMINKYKVENMFNEQIYDEIFTKNEYLNK